MAPIGPANDGSVLSLVPVATPRDLFSTLEPLLPVLQTVVTKALLKDGTPKLLRKQLARDTFKKVLKETMHAKGITNLVEPVLADPRLLMNQQLDLPLNAQALWWLMATTAIGIPPGTINAILREQLEGSGQRWGQACINQCRGALNQTLKNGEYYGLTQPTKKQRQQEREAEHQRQMFLKAQREAERIERERIEKLAAQEQLLAKLAAVCSQEPCPVTAEDFRELQVKHKSLFDEALTLPKCIKRYGLTKETRARIEAETAGLLEKERLENEARAKTAAAEKAVRDAQRAWERSLIHTSDMQKQLDITTTERDRWVTEGTLEVAQYREFYKWRQTFRTPYFDPIHLRKFTPARIAKLREKHAKDVFKSRSIAAKKAAVKTAKTRAIKKALNLENYEAQFLATRDLGREWHLCLGPTNSGKTHMAMQALAAAKSGVYLAPLRLLALENYERLKAKGIPVNLLTGEERIFDPKARHTCATVEMCNFSDVVEVAVIDEVQLLDDPQRGWAWTAALLGVPAQTVYACGAPHAHDALHQLAGICYETCSVHKFDRLVPLEVANTGVTLDKVEAGDAVIAFSRREVLQFATAIKARGLGVSVIYGALSPEVRRSQAQAFLEGRTQVVVATDAIGMGVNLPIKRIVFSAISKYDGVSNRNLTPLEVRQIGGRAGRYGLSETGVVTAFSNKYLPSIAEGLSRSPLSITAPYSVMPTWGHVETVLKELGTRDVGKAFEFFTRIKFGGQFVQADLSDCLARYEELERTWKWVGPKDMFMLCCAPADPRNDEDMSLLVSAAYALNPKNVLPIPKASFNLEEKEPDSYELQQAEAYSRELALYSWIACKWPDAVQDTELSELRALTAEFIDRALLVHKEEFVSKRKKRYGWRDEDFDDGWRHSDDDYDD